MNIKLVPLSEENENGFMTNMFLGLKKVRVLQLEELQQLGRIRYLRMLDMLSALCTAKGF